MHGISITQNSNSVVILIDTTTVKPEKVQEILKVAEVSETSQPESSKLESTERRKTGTWLDDLKLMPFKVQDGETFSRDEIYREQEDEIYGKGNE